MVCTLKENWCERHQMEHWGHLRAVALDPGPTGERQRAQWDQLAIGGYVSERPAEKTTCRFLGMPIHAGCCKERYCLHPDLPRGPVITPRQDCTPDCPGNVQLLSLGMITLRDQLARAFDAMTEYQGPATGRGFLLAGGGDFEAGNFVAIKMLRERSSLPIVLVRRQDEPLRRELFYELGADVRTLPQKISRGWQNGWPIKSLYLNAGWAGVEPLPFADVHFIDSDVVPWRNPERAFEAAAGAWYCTNYHDKIDWTAYGLAPDGMPPIDGGVWRLDLARHFAAAFVYDWLNRHCHKLSYQYGVGDQDQLRAALAACRIRAELPAAGTYYAGPGLVHDGYTHRFQDKYRTKGGHRLGNWPWPQKHTGVPGEEEAYAAFRVYWKKAHHCEPS